MSTNPKDRPFIVQAFEHIGHGEHVIVIGAHFPHGTNFHRLSEAISSVKHKTGVSSVILIADTNQESYSSVRIMEELNIHNATSSKSTAWLKSCCLNTKGGFRFPYDRIITNTPATVVTTTMLLDWLPSWVVGEFHKPILGTFTYDGSRRSGTAGAGATTTSTINSSRAPTNIPSAIPFIV